MKILTNVNAFYIFPKPQKFVPNKKNKINKFQHTTRFYTEFNVKLQHEYEVKITQKCNKIIKHFVCNKYFKYS